MEGAGFGHYIPSMIASEVMLKTSSKKCKLKTFPPRLESKIALMQYSPAPFQKSHLTYNASSFRDLLQKTHPTFKQRQRHL